MPLATAIRCLTSTRCTGSGKFEKSHPLIFHIAIAADWARALEAGEYRLSTRDRTLEDEGFIHCSFAPQLEGSANRFHAGLTGLVILTIDTDRLRSKLRVEAAGSGELFPHIYGPLNTDAVVAATPLEPGPDGRFTVPRRP